MKPAALLIELRSAADSFQFDALYARAMAADAVCLPPGSMAALSELLNRAAAALAAATTSSTPREG